MFNHVFVSIFAASLVYETVASNGYFPLENGYMGFHQLVKRESPGSSRASSVPDCKDRHKDCSRWSSSGYCGQPNTIHFMKIKCRKSCRFCKGDDASSIVKICKDNDTEICKYWAGESYCSNPLFRDYMKESCRKTCNFCQRESETLATTTILPEDTFSEKEQIFANTTENQFTTATSLSKASTSRSATLPTTSTFQSQATLTSSALTSVIIPKSTTAKLKLTVPTTKLRNESTSFTFTTMKITSTATKLSSAPIAIKPKPTTTSKFTRTSTSTSSTPKIFLLSSATTSLTPQTNFTSALPSNAKAHLVTTIQGTSTPTKIKPTFTSTSQATPAVSPTATDANSCRDLVDDCQLFAFLCDRNSYIQLQCKATCGRCSNHTTSVEMDSLHIFKPIFIVDQTISPQLSSGENSSSIFSPINYENLPEIETTSTIDITTHRDIKPSIYKTEVTTASSQSTPNGHLEPEVISENVIGTNASTEFATYPMTTVLSLDSKQFSINSSASLITSSSLPLEFTTLASRKKVAAECADEYEECKFVAAFCNVNTNVSTNCKKTCRVCLDHEDQQMTSITTAQSTLSHANNETGCEDTFTKCFALKSECERPESIKFLKQTCRKTCGFCKKKEANFTTAVREDCQDKEEICRSWSESGFCDSIIYPQLKNFMQENCRKSCNECEKVQWSTWSECSLSCGGGEQMRRKIICKNGVCDDAISEIRFCSMEVCPKNPNRCEDRMSIRSCLQYKERNACGTEIIDALCTATCGLCQNFTDSSSTAAAHDPKTEWLPWSSWSHCNASCNGGVQIRNRTCTGDSCIGLSSETISCNSFKCHFCYDSLPSCKAMERFGACRKIIWKLMCKETCAICRPVKMEGRCADAHFKCPRLKESCSKSSVIHACPATCGRCPSPTEAPLATVATLLPTNDLLSACVDQHIACPEARSSGYCSDTRIAKICQYSCGQCKKKTKTGATEEFSGGNIDFEECVDDWAFCPQLVDGCRNSSFIQNHCRATCDRCFIVQTKKKGKCVDKNPVCSTLAQNGLCETPIVASSCQLSCNFSCLSTLPSLSTGAIPTISTLACTDGHPSCGKYHALGRCDNDFIRFLCPRSCLSCEKDGERAAPLCKDAFGPMCRLFSSRCSDSIVQYGCEKTCGVCQNKALVCKDTLEKECQALGREGMCSVSSFRSRCPVTCDSCGSKSTADVKANSVDQCVDLHSNCNLLSTLCTNQLIQTICLRTCNKCTENLPANDSPCIDINPDQCRQLMAIGQCSTVPSVAFMCAKSCKKCIKKVQNCADRYDSCEESKQYCELKTIQLQCARTCGVCDQTDQENAYSLSEPMKSSKIYRECIDHISECPSYKSYCGMNRWLSYMDTMCPSSCGVCGIGSWTKWSSWSECSKSCNDDPSPFSAQSGGNRTRTRKCVDGRFCLGGKSASIEVGKCNKDRCPSLAKSARCVDQPSCKQWKADGRCQARRFRAQMEAACPLACGYCVPAMTWSSWSDCDVACGTGQQRRRLVCSYNSCKKMKNLNATETRNCTKTACDGWATWSSWSSCSSSCGVGNKLRIRSCTHTNSSFCPGPDTEEGPCGDNIKCPSWSSWSSWSDCSLSCGNGTKLRNRTCQNQSGNLTCDGSSTGSERCNLEACPEWGRWGAWTNCSISCGGVGFQSRLRVCSGPLKSCGNENNSREERSCGSNLCPAWTEWSEWSLCSATCGSEGTQRRSRDCQKNDDHESCEGSASETRECSSKQECVRWTKWSEFSECNATCGGGYSIRTRICNSTSRSKTEDSKECPGDAIERKPCNCDPCPDLGVWSLWGNFSKCSASCNGGTKTRRRICLNGIPGRGGCQGPSYFVEKCGLDSCPLGKWDQWSPWSLCSLSCGLGSRSRSRTCIGGFDGMGGCRGENKIFENCNSHSCPAWSQWGDWSGCSASCGSSGLQTRSRFCYDHNLEKRIQHSFCGGSSEITEEKTCNIRDCPGWAKWGSWGDCSASCGVGLVSRQRECQNGEIGDLGCHFRYSVEKQLCNIWDCPAVCRGVPLRSEWHDATQVVRKDSLQDTQDETNSSLSNEPVTCLNLNKTGRWVQVSFKRQRAITGITMRGYQNISTKSYSWVKTFLVSYGNDKDDMSPIMDNAGRPRIFDGPNGPIETVERHWRPITARFWRIRVLSSHPSQWVCMVSKLQRCRYSDELVYSLEGSGVVQPEKP